MPRHLVPSDALAHAIDQWIRECDTRTVRQLAVITGLSPCTLSRIRCRRHRTATFETADAILARVDRTHVWYGELGAWYEPPAPCARPRRRRPAGRPPRGISV
jgi:hypothetical protein